MSILFIVLHAIKSFYTFPIQVWKNGIPYCYNDAYLGRHQVVHTEKVCSPSQPDHITGLVLAVFIYGGTVIVIALLVKTIRLMYSRYVFKRDSQPCQHNCGTLTVRTSDGTHNGCTTHQHCCATCDLQHRLDESPDKTCSNDGIDKVVVPIRNNYFHWCPECGDITMTQEVALAMMQLLDNDVEFDLFEAIAATYESVDA